MATRYKKEDEVVETQTGYVGMVVDVENPKSKSPDYYVAFYDQRGGQGRYKASDLKKVETAEGYVWNLEETGGLTAEKGDYNLTLSESPVEYRRKFSGTFNNRELEPIEGASAYVDLEEIANQGLKIKVYYYQTRKRAGYQKIVDYKVIS